MLNTKQHPSRHIADDVLLQYLDGELPSSQMADVRTHLAACWSCRGRASEFKQSIRLFLQYRKAAIQQLGGPPQQFRGFHAQLRLQTEDMAQRATRTAPPQGPAWLAWAGSALRCITIPRAAMAAVTSAVLVWYLVLGGAPVSAQAVLKRAVVSESARLGSVGRPVIHQCLRVSAGGRQATWEIWQAPKESKVRNNWTGGQALSRELSTVLAANHLDVQRPLSAAGFTSWRDSLASKRETVHTDEQAHAVVISTEFVQARSGQIRNAVFTVRDSDWHPISQAFDVQTGSGNAVHYSLEETSYAVVPIEQVAAEVFATPEPALALAAGLHIKAREPEPTPAPAGISEEQLTESEVLLREALHSMGADIREAPEVHRANDHIELSLWTNDQARERQILASIEPIPAVVAHVNGMGVTTTPAAPQHAAPATYTTQPPLAKALKDYTGSAQAAANYLAAVSDASQKLRVETAALRRLAAAYPEDQWRLLPAASRNRLDGIAVDHIAAIHSTANEYLALLAPVLDALVPREGPTPAAEEPPSETSTWRAVAPELDATVPHLQTSFRRLFMEDHVESPQTPVSTREQLSETLSARAHLHVALGHLGTPKTSIVNQ